MKDQNRANQGSKIADNQDRDAGELSDQELDEVSGGITPIPIPEVNLSQYLQQSIKPALNPALNPKSFEGGGGIG